MKTLQKLSIAAAVVVVGATLSAKAGEPFYSPKAGEQAASLQNAPGAVNDPDLTAIHPNGNARMWETRQSVRSVPGTGTGIDLVNAPRPSLAPKDPDYDAAWRARAVGGQEYATTERGYEYATAE